MPSRNTVRYDVPESYYHVYARGASKLPIYLEHSDYTYFIYLLKRYLGKQQVKSKEGVFYPNYHKNVHLLAFCLMNNHFHLMLYQKDTGDIAKFMKSIMISYCRYFNLKYKRSGALFESRYKASHVSSDNYLQHISRYIHLNPRSWRNYSYSSLSYYKQGNEPDWLNTDKILGLFNKDKQSYVDFIADHEDYKEMLSEIKHELADN